MSEVKYVKSKIEGRAGVFTPFNRAFVDELKRNVPSAKWNGEAWFFDEMSRSEVEALVEKYFPGEDTFETVRIEWDLSRDDPQIDGVSLASIDRDFWSWRRDCPVQFKVIEAGDVNSGGSRKNPGLFGKLVIEAKVRPGAMITPKPVSVIVVENGVAPNPLSNFSTEALIAELKRREETNNG